LFPWLLDFQLPIFRLAWEQKLQSSMVSKIHIGACYFGNILIYILVRAKALMPTAAMKKSGDAKLLDKVHAATGYASGAGKAHCYAGLFGMSQIVVACNSKEFIAGFKAGDLQQPSNSAAEQIDSLKHKTSSVLVDALEHQPGAFCIMLQPGQLLVIPSGYLLVTFSSAGFIAIRKGFTPSFPTEKPRVLSMVMSIMEGYPEFRQSAWASWATVLDSTN